MPRLQPPSSADFVTALAELPPGVCPGECDCAAGRAPPPRHGSGRELLTARCQAMSTASYLSRVYPTASTAFQRDAKSARRLFDTLDFFYDHGCASQPVACREPGILLRYLPGYEQMLPCSVEQSLCLQRHSGFSPPWTQSLHATGWVEVEHRAFGLGIPAYALPGEGRNAPAGASDFMDAGAAGMWYVLRRGSGIFYDLGKRTAVAPGKNAMMALLLREAARDPQLDEAWRARAQASGLFRTRRLPPAMAPPTAALRLPAYNGSAGARRDGDRIAATANGSSDCLKMRLRYCRCRYLLSDQWDHAMIWLARALGYETLCCAPDAARLRALAKAARLGLLHTPLARSHPLACHVTRTDPWLRVAPVSPASSHVPLAPRV